MTHALTGRSADEVAVGGRADARPTTAIPPHRRPSTHPHPRPRARGDRGAVAAEAAAVLPVLAAVALALVWLVALAAGQVRVVDAARETARLAARGEGPAAVAAGQRVAPGGARISVVRDGEVVRVVVSAEPPTPSGLLGFLPGPTLRSEAVAVVEPG